LGYPPPQQDHPKDEGISEMKYYVIADLHGRYDLFLEALTRIDMHVLENKVEEYKIITLGDYIDRGPQSKEIIEYLMDAGDRFVSLQGNHEDMAVQSIALELNPSWWMGNGGNTTMESYGNPKVRDRNFGSDVYYSFVPQEHVKWMNVLPLYYETEKQVFVHAGIHDTEAPLAEQQFDTRSDGARYMQWMLYHPSDHGGWRGKHVVHGHHQFSDGPHKFIDPKHGGRTNLDVYAWKTGRLVVGVFDDTQLHAVDYLEIKDEEAGS
jgi:serine/threonine protein phosphatase 1